MKENKVQTFCQQCHMKCRIFVTIQNGQISGVKSTADPEGAKIKHVPELIYHRNRVVYPKKRTGERGEGRWQRVSWEEALETMSQRFSEIKGRYGAEAIATIRG